jgi:hypothetical protein
MTKVSKRDALYDSPVMVVVKTNPKKNPSMSYDRFENYFKLEQGATVRDALKVGVRMDDIRHDTEHGFIVVGTEGIKELEERLVEEKKAAIEAARALLASIEEEEKEEVE